MAKTPQWGSRIDAPKNSGYTRDWRDSDKDGVDDRAQRGPGKPEQKIGQGPATPRPANFRPITAWKKESREPYGTNKHIPRTTQMKPGASGNTVAKRPRRGGPTNAFGQGR